MLIANIITYNVKENAASTAALFIGLLIMEYLNTEYNQGIIQVTTRGITFPLQMVSC